MKHDAQWRTIRETLGLTQAQWAAVLNVAPMTVSKWERELRTPDARTRAILDRLADLTTEAAAQLGTAVRAALELKGTLEAFRLLLDTREKPD